MRCLIHLGHQGRDLFDDLVGRLLDGGGGRVEAGLVKEQRVGILLLVAFEDVLDIGVLERARKVGVVLHAPANDLG